MREKNLWARRAHGINWCWGDRVSTPPVRWSSSERPLSVRTVWVGGVRHAILSTDDPLLQYQGQPYYQRSGSSSTSTMSETSSDASNELEECLVKLRVALDSSDKSRLPPIESSLINCSSRDPSPCSSPALSVLPQNPLSERVLQWLDLASKGHTMTKTLLPKKSRNNSSNVKLLHPKRKIHARSATVDIPQISHRKSCASVSKAITAKESSPSAMIKEVDFSIEVREELPQQNEIRIPAVAPQRYEPLRPLTAWPSTNKPIRPQLHIFIPPLEQSATTSVKISDNKTYTTQ